ncbi:unnamed protein product, partial [marine sediment metagenome]
MRRWFYKDHFKPRDIEKVPAWVRYPESHRKVYRFLCWHSYLTKHSPTRRYTVWTYQQIADHVGLSRIQVLRIMHRLMDDLLIYRWYAGDSGSTILDGRPRPPRYELPASKGMIYWWGRVRELQQKIFHKREEVNH